MNHRTTIIDKPSPQLLEWARNQQKLKGARREELSKKLHQEKK